MLQNKYKIAREIIDEYNHAYLQGETFLHIQEWVDEQDRKASKEKSITFDEIGRVVDVNTKMEAYCEDCGSMVRYQKVSFSTKFVPILRKVLDHVIEKQKATGQRVNTLHIQDLALSHTEYTIMNKICNFGLLYREVNDEGVKMVQSRYGVPTKRIFDFLKGDWEVAQFYVVKSTTKERILSKSRVTIDQINKDTGFVDYQTKQLPKYVEYINNDFIS